MQYILEIPLPIHTERMVFFLLTHLVVWHWPQKLGERREKCVCFICDWKYRKGHKCGENKLFYIYCEDENQKNRKHYKLMKFIHANFSYSKRNFFAPRKTLWMSLMVLFKREKHKGWNKWKMYKLKNYRHTKERTFRNKLKYLRRF